MEGISNQALCSKLARKCIKPVMALIGSWGQIKVRSLVSEVMGSGHKVNTLKGNKKGWHDPEGCS